MLINGKEEGHFSSYNNSSHRFHLDNPVDHHNDVLYQYTVYSYIEMFLFDSNIDFDIEFSIHHYHQDNLPVHHISNSMVHIVHPIGIYTSRTRTLITYK